MSVPTPLHWVAMRKVLQYLSGTQEIGITLSKVKDFSISGFCNANWGGDATDMKSQTGILINVGDTPIS